MSVNTDDMPDTIFAWKEEMGDVHTGEWSPYPDEDGDPPRGKTYISADIAQAAVAAPTDTPNLSALAMRTLAAEAAYQIVSDNDGHREGEIVATAILALPLEADPAALVAEALRLPEVAAMVTQLEAWLEVASHCSITEGVCCCGDNMEGHAEPMNCGHSPVDHGSYHADGLVKSTTAALAALVQP